VDEVVVGPVARPLLSFVLWTIDCSTKSHPLTTDLGKFELVATEGWPGDGPINKSLSYIALKDGPRLPSSLMSCVFAVTAMSSLNRNKLS